MTEKAASPVSRAPANVTELGAIAYRLDALCSRLFDDMGAEYVRPFWDVHDAIVAYGMAHLSTQDNTDSSVSP